MPPAQSGGNSFDLDVESDFLRSRTESEMMDAAQVDFATRARRSWTGATVARKARAALGTAASWLGRTARSVGRGAGPALGSVLSFARAAWSQLRALLPARFRPYLPGVTFALGLLLGLPVGAALFGGTSPTQANDPGALVAAEPVKAAIPNGPAAVDQPRDPEVIGDDADEPVAPSEPSASTPSGTDKREGACELTVVSSPSGAEITLDGSPAGTTPTEITDLPCGEPIQLVVRAQAQEDWKKTLTLRDGESKKLRVSLHRPRTTLRVTSTPPGARVRLGGKTLGKTPFSTNVIVGQRNNVTVSLYGYVEESKTVRAKAGEPASVDFSLTRARASFLGGKTR